jgi:hypothetical protein
VGQDRIGVARSDQLGGGAAVKTSQRLVAEPDNGTASVTEQVSGCRHDPRDLTETGLHDWRGGMALERIAVKLGEARELRRRHVQHLAQAIGEKQTAAPIGDGVE